jgi:hypothetical protein
MPATTYDVFLDGSCPIERGGTRVLAAAIAPRLHCDSELVQDCLAAGGFWVGQGLGIGQALCLAAELRRLGALTAVLPTHAVPADDDMPALLAHPRRPAADRPSPPALAKVAS